MPKFNPGWPTSSWQVAEATSFQCRCLWQPCNRSFSPSHPTQTFCCENCRQAAVEAERIRRRKEACDRARKKYRPTDRGRSKHAQYCREYRQRKRELAVLESLSSTPTATESGPHSSPREGDTNLPKTRRPKKSFCHRPGCSVGWNLDPRAPHKKLCSSLCDNALRAACARVERYYKSRGSIGRITPANRQQVLLAKPGSRAQLRLFESVVLRC